MNTLEQFRRWFYASMFLGMAVLTYAEADLLLESSFIFIAACVLLVSAYRVERLWELSLRDANLVGMLLGVFILIWIGAQFFWSESLIYSLPMPAVMLPFLGPIVVLLIPAKLLRPKHAGDYWAMFGLSGLCVALGCSMAEDAGAWLLIMAWLYATVRALEGFVRCRDLRLILGPTEAGTVATTPLGNFSKLARPLAFRRFLGIAAFGTLAFLLTPRLDTAPWELLSRKGIETGLPTDGVDLTRTGNLTPSKDRVFEVLAQDRDGDPDLELDPNTRWRAYHLQKYDGGRWHKDTKPPFDLQVRAGDSGGDPRAKIASHPGIPHWPFPDLGPDELFLTFRPLRRDTAKTLVMDPVAWKPHEPSPIMSAERTHELAWEQAKSGEFLPRTVGRRDGSAAHYQVWSPPAEREMSPPMRIVPEYLDDLTRYTNVPVVQRFARELLARLVREGRLSSGVGERIDSYGFPHWQDREEIARSFDAYFSSGREFTYTLDLRRVDGRLDPVEDFLKNIKAGHCERYATALVLCLRTLAIPCRMVVGYKGWDSRGDGWYDVRQEHAHAWAEALIARPDPDDPREKVYRWLTLDPTPNIEAIVNETPGTWLSEAKKAGSQIFRELFLNNAPITERLDGARQRASEWLSEGTNTAFVWAGAGAVAVVSAVWIWRRSRRRSRPGRVDAAPGMLAPWIPLLKPVVGLPAVGETWASFAASLRSNGKTSGFDDLLDEFEADVAAYYRANYAGAAPPADWLESRAERLRALQPRIDQWHATAGST